MKKTKIGQHNIEDNKVVVTYMTASSTSSFNFMYETMSTEKILHLSYSANDENIASIVTKNMIEAVSVDLQRRCGKVLLVIKSVTVKWT